MSDIFLKNISHSYDKKENSVLKNVNLTIKKGEFFTLLGPSGCGKTTLLRILAGFIQPTEGQVCIGEQDITVLQPEKRNMGIVFQNYAVSEYDGAGQHCVWSERFGNTRKTENQREM